VVVNAAGPYRETAMAVARACHEAGCAYVDLCGEVDVLSNLVGASDLVSPKRSILVGAGFTPVASVLVLDYLHFYTPPDDDAAPRHVHVGYTAPPRLTKGSLSTVFGTSGGSVTTFRRGFAHCIPAGSHERVFAFFGSRRLCSAISMADPWAIIDWSSRLEPIQAVDPQAFLEATRLRAHARDQTDLRLVSQGEIGRFILRAGLATQL
jgi:hypothetical protein